MLFVIEAGRVRRFREYAGYIGGVGEFTGISRADDGAEAYDYKRRK